MSVLIVAKKCVLSSYNSDTEDVSGNKPDAHQPSIDNKKADVGAGVHPAIVMGEMDKPKTNVLYQKSQQRYGQQEVVLKSSPNVAA